MCKGKLAVLGVLAVSLFVVTGIAFAGIIDPCVSYWSLDQSEGTPSVLFTCPQGDNLRTFQNQANLCAPAGPIVCGSGALPSYGWIITVCVLESDGTPIPGIPLADFWLNDCGTCSPTGFTPPAIVGYCGGDASSNADSLTNSAGMTTMSQSTFVGGGCADEMSVVVQGFTLLDTTVAPCASAPPFCCPIVVRSPDINGDLIIGAQDVGVFSGDVVGGWNTRSDMNFDGPALGHNAQDVGIFSTHAATNHNCI